MTSWVLIVTNKASALSVVDKTDGSHLWTGDLVPTPLVAQRQAD